MSSTKAIQRKQRRGNAETMTRVPRIGLGNRIQFGFPTTLLTKLRYNDTYNLTSTAGTIAKQVMGLNSIFDPDISGGGHQPLYRDTFAAVYDQYSVVSSKITVQFANLHTATSAHVGLLLDDDSSTSSTYSVLMEQNRGINTLLAPLAGGLSVNKLSLNFDCQRDLGIDPYTSETYKTAIGSNATEVMDCLVWAAPADTSSTGTVQAVVTIEYLVFFTELQTPTSS